MLAATQGVSSQLGPLSLEDVRTALTQNTINAPKGSFDGTRQSYAIGANDQILSAAEYRQVIVAYKHGSPVRLAVGGRDVIAVIGDEGGDPRAWWTAIRQLAARPRSAS